jgi:hypothetical protein
MVDRMHNRTNTEERRQHTLLVMVTANHSSNHTAVARQAQHKPMTRENN